MREAQCFSQIHLRGDRLPHLRLSASIFLDLIALQPDNRAVAVPMAVRICRVYLPQLGESANMKNCPRVQSNSEQGVVYVTNSSLSLVCDFVIFSIPIAIISNLKLSKERKIMLAFVLLPGTLVIIVSCVRLYLCVVGQWRDDGSWYYDPQVATEVAEISGTLIALSVSLCSDLTLPEAAAIQVNFAEFMHRYLVSKPSLAQFASVCVAPSIVLTLPAKDE